MGAAERIKRSIGDREGWIYPRGGSKLHFPGLEWQINKQFAFAAKGGGESREEKNNLRRTQTPRRDPSENGSPSAFPSLIFLATIHCIHKRTHSHTNTLKTCIQCI
jgi:hypothetical protein